MSPAICASCPSRCQTTLGERINSRPRGRVCHDIREHREEREEYRSEDRPLQGKRMATPYKITIPMYEGPLDLLLDLIKQQKMNIHDIQISGITAQYLNYLHNLEELDVDVSSEFIYMAATLIYIKSKMLLPPDPLVETEEAGGGPRAELGQRPGGNQKIKNAAPPLVQEHQV